YVWFDALINYISAIGFVDDKKKFKELWPADAHIMAKDIIRQHAIYWPIMLKAIGLELPRMIVAHGWWKIGDIKMSKSRGNVVDPFEMADRYGVDSFRYFLLRDVTFGTDGNFSTESFEKRFNGDLANDLGNLVYRTLGMIEKYTGGKIPRLSGQDKEEDARLLSRYLQGALMKEDFRADFSQYNFTGALNSIWDVIKAANKSFEVIKPWNLKKDNNEAELLDYFKFLIRVLEYTAEKILPFMPQTSALIREQISTEAVEKKAPLFPRLEKKE
ncbi:MAG: class I tRNA ligase family protein, partial [Candidatus Omnitrophota bacterium]